jgi:lipopolysaccharide export system permease protein
MNIFILRSYFGPFLRSLAVSLFILVIQFLSRYKGDIFGKGLDTWVLLKIFAFASASLFVLALPVSVLLASLSTMGSFGENYELAAMRSGGMSLQRILRPMVVSTVLISLLSFSMSSYVVPLANLKLYSLLYDIQKLKPTFSLQPGHFNASVDNYVIRIVDKDIARDVLYDVLIYDHSSQQGNDRMVRADSAMMVVDPYGRYMHMALYKGVSYEARKPGGAVNVNKEGMVRIYFDTLFYNFDLQGFNLERTEEQAFSTHQYMLNLAQLQWAVDSIKMVKTGLISVFGDALKGFSKVDTAFLAPSALGPPPAAIDTHMLANFPKGQFMEILNRAGRSVQNMQEISRQAQGAMDEQDLATRERMIELHAKYSLPIACLVFLFVGAPLGAIIRKGGVGLPILVSITLYLSFYVLMIQGKKLAGEAVVPVWVGVWLPNLVLMPLAILLTFESANATRMLSAENLGLVGGMILRVVFGYLNPLYWLWQIPPVQRGIIFVLRPIVRRLFPEREQKRKMRVR